MTEQLYRWVKASERLPERTKLVYLQNYERLSKGYISKDWHEGQKCFFISISCESGEREPLTQYREGHEGLRLIEWLEPIPYLNAGSLEEAKEVCAKFVGENHKCTLWEIFEQGMRFAGAAYVKGGEEIVQKYAVELSQWILHRFHSTEYDKDILKWKWNQTLWSSQEMFERFIGEEYPDFVIPGASRPSLDAEQFLNKLRAAIPDSDNPYDRQAFDYMVEKAAELLNQSK